MPTAKPPKTVIVIPARLESTRLPRKLLLDQTGKSLIEHTYCSALCSELASEVIVATDSREISDCVSSFGGKVVMTRTDHVSGSSRVAEAVESLDAEIIVNVQGDEPEISGEAIDAAIRILANSSTAAISTLATPLETRAQLEDPSVVKVVFDRQGRAMYFSRSPIPCPRQWSDQLLTSKPATFYQHVGLYAYRKSFMAEMVNLPAAVCETVESLEQLRFLDSGYEIQVGIVQDHASGIDTPEDYESFVRRLSAE